MKLLAIDTSTKNLSLAVSQDEKILKFRNVKLLKPLSSSIIPSIKNILSAAELTLNDLDGFVIGLGPGSFTSLRVGLSTIKGLAFAVKKPVVGISSLDVLAMNVKENNVQVCVLNDAKRNLVYSCLFEKNGVTLKQKTPYALEDIQETLKKIKGDVVFIGDGIPLFKNDIQKARGIKAEYYGEDKMFPQARYLISLTIERFQKSQYDDIDSLVPLYLYPEHCQVRNKA